MVSASSAPASIKVELVEPFIFLRKPPRWSIESQEQGGTDTRCQLRGVATFVVSQPNVRGDRVQIDLVGRTTSVHFHKGAPIEEAKEDSRQSITLALLSDGQSTLPLGQHSLPFSITVPSDLPPTIDVEFGKVVYHVHASLLSAGEQVSISNEPVSVRVLHDSAWNAVANENVQQTLDTVNDDPPRRSRSQQMDWRDALHIDWTMVNDWADIGSYAPVKLDLAPLTSEDVCIHSISMRLNECTTNIATSVAGATPSASHQVKRFWRLLDVSRTQPCRQPILPYAKDPTLPMDDAKIHQQLQDANIRAQCTHLPNVKAHHSDQYQDEAKQTSEAKRIVASKQGPWSFAWDVQLPVCAKYRCSVTIHHPRSPVRIDHNLQLDIDVEVIRNGEKIRRIVSITLPFTIRSLYYTQSYAELPCYYCAACLPHPYEARETRTEGGLLAYYEGQEPQSSPSLPPSDHHHNDPASSPPSSLSEYSSSLSTDSATSSGRPSERQSSSFGLISSLASAFFSPSASKKPIKQKTTAPPAYTESDDSSRPAAAAATASSPTTLDQFIETRQRVASQWLLLSSNHH